MKQDHVITDELFDAIQTELSAGNKWIAYNTMNFFLDKGDMYFFNTKEDAQSFSRDNVSDVDDYRVLYADSYISLIRQLPSEVKLGICLTTDDLEELFNSFDWKKTNYDPLHDHLEASTEEEKNDLAKMETLLYEWESLYNANPQEALAIAAKYWEADFTNNIIQNVMNEKNLKYLQDNVRNHGFGDSLQSDLQMQLEKGAPEFRLAFQTEFNRRNIDATLHFKRSDSSDMYFFNKYDARVETERNKETLAQTFYLNKGQGVTLKEQEVMVKPEIMAEKIQKTVDKDIDKDDQKKTKLKTVNESKGLIEKKREGNKKGLSL